MQRFKNNIAIFPKKWMTEEDKICNAEVMKVKATFTFMSLKI